MNRPVPVIAIGWPIARNLFMPVAWYGRFKLKTAPLIVVILIRWGIAVFECLVQVPANRIGYGHYLATQMKTTQDLVSVPVFALLSGLYPGERLGRQHAVGFSLICLGAWFVFHEWV